MITLRNNGWFGKMLCIALLLLWPLVMMAQKEDDLTAAASLTDKASLARFVAHFKTLYGFQKGDTIASVGAGNGLREVNYSMMDDSLCFYVQDIDPDWLSVGELTMMINRQYNRADISSTSSFVVAIGTQYATRLPRNKFTKVIMENSLHEFTQMDQMLDDIWSTLKPGGELFVWELIAKKPGRIHPGCLKMMFSEAQLLEKLSQHGFRFVRSVPVYANKPKNRLYMFTRIE